MFCGITRCAACLDLICHIEIVYSIRRALYTKASSICRHQKPAIVIVKLFLRTAKQCMTFGEGTSRKHALWNGPMQNTDNALEPAFWNVSEGVPRVEEHSHTIQEHICYVIKFDFFKGSPNRLFLGLFLPFSLDLTSSRITIQTYRRTLFRDPFLQRTFLQIHVYTLHISTA